jgi:hypothetical protein
MTKTRIASLPKKTISATEPIVHQQILLDQRGFVLESTDTIFKADRHRPAAEWSFFFASLSEVLSKMPMHTTEISLPHIQSVTNFVDGLYDCSFMRVQYCDVEEVIVWNIMNQTPQLAALQAFQQRLNEKLLNG